MVSEKKKDTIRMLKVSDHENYFDQPDMNRHVLLSVIFMHVKGPLYPTIQ